MEGATGQPCTPQPVPLLSFLLPDRSQTATCMGLLEAVPILLGKLTRFEAYHLQFMREFTEESLLYSCLQSGQPWIVAVLESNVHFFATLVSIEPDGLRMLHLPTDYNTRMQASMIDEPGWSRSLVPPSMPAPSDTTK